MVWSLLGYETKPAPSTKHKRVADETEETVQEALECDYEANCTPLYKKIENALTKEDWVPIVKFLDTGYWPGSLFMDSIPPADQVKTWVTRFDPGDSTKVRWSQLPLHLAIVCCAPFKVVGRLVELYPAAVRCTDDQHMLPLHLALRHGATDEIVAYLLMQFPEAVNAKGKDARTPVECAMRAEDKLRGKILQIFIDKTKSKHTGLGKELSATKAALEAKSAEVEELKAQVKELQNSTGKIGEIESAKWKAEEVLSKRIAELEIEKAELESSTQETIRKLKDERLVETIESQKRIETLEKTKKELLESEKKVKAEEKALRAELEEVEKKVTSVAPKELNTLKKEVDELKAYRLQKSRTMTQEQIDNLRTEMAKTLEQSENKNSQEIKAMQKMLTELYQAEHSAKTSADLTTLREEVETLRAELRDKEEASKTKAELAELKKEMETQFLEKEGKTQEELRSLKGALAALNVPDLETKTNTELSSMKAELESLRKEMKENELATQTKKDVEDLKALLEEELTKTRGVTTTELATVKKQVDDMSKELAGPTTNEAIISMKKELEIVKDELKKNEVANKTKADVEELRATLEQEIKAARGSTKEELASMKKQVDKLHVNINDNKSAEEIVALKKELEAVKEELKVNESANKIKEDVEELRKTLDKGLKEARGSAKEDLAEMKKQVDALHTNISANKSKEDIVALKEDLEKVKSEVKTNEVANKTREDVDMLRATLDKELKEARGSTKTELALMKKQVDTIHTDISTNKSDSDIVALKKEVEALKDEMRQKEAANQLKLEMVVMKKALEAEIRNSEGKTKEDINQMKKLVKSVDERKLESKSYDELSDIKTELETLKNSLVLKEDVESTMKELAAMKAVLEKQMQEWNGKSRDEIAMLKDSVDAMSVAPLESKSVDEMEVVKAELSSLKADVKSAEQAFEIKKELEILKKTLEEELIKSKGNTEEELAAMKDAVDAIDVEHLEIKNKEEWDAIREELSALKEDLKTKEIGSIVLKKELDELKTSSASVTSSESKPKKPMRGVRKFFSRFRKSGKKSIGKPPLAPTSGPSTVEAEPVEEPPMPDDETIHTIHPPSVAKSDAASKTSASKASKASASKSDAASKASASVADEKSVGSTKSAKSAKSAKSTKSTRSRSSKSETKVEEVEEEDPVTAETPKAQSSSPTPYEVVRTISKTMADTGEIELSMDDEEPIKLLKEMDTEGQTVVSF